MMLPALGFAQSIGIAQMSMSKLPSGERNFGLGYAGIEGLHTLLFGLDLGLTDSVKGSAVTTLTLIEDEYSYFILSETFQFIFNGDIGTTNLGYNILGAVGGIYLATTETESGFASGEYIPNYPYENDPIVNDGLQSIHFVGGGNLFATLGQFKPFLSYTFTHIRIFNFGSANSNLLTLGTELDISQNISLIARSSWPYTSDGFHKPTIGFGINFH